MGFAVYDYSREMEDRCNFNQYVLSVNSAQALYRCHPVLGVVLAL
jgi:hypothetical protein